MNTRDATTTTSEVLLLPRVARGEPGSMEALIERYGALVWSVVRKSIRDHAKAEDAVQEVFLSLCKAAEGFDASLGAESVFVATIARRRLVDCYRRLQRAPEHESLDEVVLADEDAGLAEVDLQDEVQRAYGAIERLKPRQRQLFEMWIVAGMTHAEIATSTGLPLGTVKSQLRRGILRVRGWIQGGALPATEEASR